MNPKILHIYLGVLLTISIIVGTGIPKVYATNDCDKALSIFWKGKYTNNKARKYRFYEVAINLCPGFIRPYELIGNLYRKDGETKKAIEYFTQAAELGTTNYKLYYLLASLQFQSGDLDGASRNLKKSLSIRGDYPKALDLKKKIEIVENCCVRSHPRHSEFNSIFFS